MRAAWAATGTARRNVAFCLGVSATAAVGVLTWGRAASASACTPTAVDSVGVKRSVAHPATAVAAAGASRSLAFTGAAGIAVTVLVAGCLLAGGLLLLAWGRHHAGRRAVPLLLVAAGAIGVLSLLGSHAASAATAQPAPTCVADDPVPVVVAATTVDATGTPGPAPALPDASAPLALVVVGGVAGSGWLLVRRRRPTPAVRDY